MDMLASIDAPDTATQKGFNCGVVLRNNVVVRAAPIVGYMQTRKFTRDQVRAYCKQRGWTVTVVWEMERTK